MKIYTIKKTFQYSHKLRIYEVHNTHKNSSGIQKSRVSGNYYKKQYTHLDTENFQKSTCII